MSFCLLSVLYRVRSVDDVSSAMPPALGSAEARLADCCPCSLAAASGITIGQHDGFSGASTCAGDALEMEGLFFEQAVEHTPSESAVAATTLQRQVHDF